MNEEPHDVPRLGRTEAGLRKAIEEAACLPPWSPKNPDGDMVPILQASIEAAKMRHPSTDSDVLTAADRCDRCGAAAGYRVAAPLLDPDAWVGFGEPDGPRKQEAMPLDFCVHHWRKYFPAMSESGWVVVGAHPDINTMLGGAAA